MVIVGHILFVAKYTYVVNPNGNNKLSKAIQTMLKYKLQPYVDIKLNNYLYDLLKRKEGNSSLQIEYNNPYILDKEEYGKNCISDDDDYGHAVNLRAWGEGYIDFKNSWSEESGNKGNFSIKDLKYLICDNNNFINFGSLMFRYEKIDNLTIKDKIKSIFKYEKKESAIKQKLDNRLSLYYQTVDLDLDIKRESLELYDSYGLLNGNVIIFDYDLRFKISRKFCK